MISMRFCRRAGRAPPQALEHMAADRVPSHRVIFSPQRAVRYVAGRVMRWRQDRDGLRSPELLDIEPLMSWYYTRSAGPWSIRRRVRRRCRPRWCATGASACIRQACRRRGSFWRRSHRPGSAIRYRQKAPGINRAKSTLTPLVASSSCFLIAAACSGQSMTGPRKG